VPENLNATVARRSGTDAEFLARLSTMPSIELVCINQKTPIDFSDMPFIVVADTEPVSHRSQPLFRRELSRLRGCTYHIGNPDCRKRSYRGPYFAYEVLSPESRERLRSRFFEVTPEFRDSFRTLVHLLLDASPIHSVFFTTDWQFGPVRPTRGGVLSESAFWKTHDGHLLKLNACYTITRQ
jgi:hypothetical protein